MCLFCHIWLFSTPWTVAHQAPLFMEFSRQEYWSGLPLPTPDLPDPRIKPTSLVSLALAGGFCTPIQTKKFLKKKKKDWLSLYRKKKRRWLDKMIGWQHQNNGYELEQTPGDAEGQENLMCCSLWSRKESDTTVRLNNKARNLARKSKETDVLKTI